VPWVPQLLGAPTLCVVSERGYLPYLVLSFKQSSLIHIGRDLRSVFGDAYLSPPLYGHAVFPLALRLPVSPSSLDTFSPVSTGLGPGCN
jgi:hypothetical protein